MCPCTATTRCMTHAEKADADANRTAEAHDLYLDQIDDQKARRLARILQQTGRYGSEAVAVVDDVLAAIMIDEADA